MGDRHGPMRTGLFKVEIDGVEVPGWQYVNIPAISTEPDGGGWGETTRQDLEAGRGMAPGDTQLHDWNEAVIEGDEEDGLKTFVVILMDEEGAPQVEWTFEEAWITYYQPPQLDATADGQIAMERISLAYESMDRQEA